MSKAIYFVLCLSAMATIGRANSPVTIQPSGVYNSRVANQGFRIRVEPHPDNRRLTLVCDSGTALRSGEDQLEGENSPSTHRFEFILDPGEYECKATLQRSANGQKKEFLDRINLTVLGV